MTPDRFRVNNDVAGDRTISAPASGVQADTGSLGLERNKSYYIFDFWNQKPLAILAGKDALSAQLAAGEALVFSVKQVENHPQILGTNRHVMCGMMELSKTNWHHEKKRLEFTADLVAGETMSITIAIPAGAKYRASAVKSNTAKVFYKQAGQYVKVFASSEKNGRSDIEVLF